jgi:hypothetical protein
VVQPSPKDQNPFFFFFFFGLLGVAGPPPLAMGVVRPPSLAMGVVRPPLEQAIPWPKMGWSGHPILAKGVVGATLDFFYIYIYLKKKLMAKTTSFWARWEDEMVKKLKAKMGISFNF